VQVTLYPVSNKNRKWEGDDGPGIYLHYQHYLLGVMSLMTRCVVKRYDNGLHA
jgi:hypothetical protein